MYDNLLNQLLIRIITKIKQSTLSSTLHKVQCTYTVLRLVESKNTAQFTFNSSIMRLVAAPIKLNKKKKTSKKEEKLHSTTKYTVNDLKGRSNIPPF